MGEILKFNGFKIFINSNEHYPPHVHVYDLNSGIRTRIRIDNGEYLKGDDILRAGYSKIKKLILKELKDKCINEWNRLNPQLPYKEGVEY